MKLWIANVASGTTDDGFREFVKKYAPDLECGNIQRIEGDGSRPAATLDCADAPYALVEKISTRLNAMSWKGRALSVYPQSR